jgi:PAS domain S-box-containing protein
VHFEYDLPIGGSQLWFAATASPMLPDMVVWVARDVTERKHAEQQVREGEDRWRRISEAAFEGIGFSENGVMIDVNAQLAQMLGYTQEEIIGLPVERCVAPEDRARVASAMRSQRPDAYEHRAMRKDGSTFPVEVRARALTLHGRAIRVTAIRDLSERTRLETELRRREKLATMGSLVAGVAHEVRTPLFSLSATLDALEAGVGTADEQRELRDLLRAQVRRLSGLMQDLLDYGRPPQLKLALGSIQGPIDRVVRSCEAQARHTGVRIAVRLPADPPDVRIDPGRLEQVFENLLVNALQHAPRGSGVTLSVAQVIEPPGLACVVEDEGPGLAAADMERIFEPFFSRRRGGTGLGLAIAQRLVEAHGGSLTAGNRPGGGAAFTVMLPLGGDGDGGDAHA